jgi:hypothetical protein
MTLEGRLGEAISHSGATDLSFHSSSFVSHHPSDNRLPIYIRSPSASAKPCLDFDLRTPN